MTDNQKILAGCGGLGCVGLICILLAVGAYFYLIAKTVTSTYSTGNYNSSTYNSADGTRSGSSSTSSASNMSDDDKHKLFQAAGITQDGELITRVLKKLGFMREDGTTTPEYNTFISAHGQWAARNLSFINQYRAPERARQYVMDHIND